MNTLKTLLLTYKPGGQNENLNKRKVWCQSSA